MFAFQNNVKIAVQRVGGPTKAANAAGVSNATIHSWIKRAKIVNIEKARIIAKLAGMDIQELRPTR